MIKISSKIDPVDIVTQAMRIPGVKISREDFLYKQLRYRYPPTTVRKSIDMNPAAAGILREDIEILAKESIKYETAKVSAISTLAGIPGGFALIGTIPADLAQYFGFILRIVQKLAYLYGFDEFRLQEDELDDPTLNDILVFLGVMFGVDSANIAISKIANRIAEHVVRAVPRKALTKGTVYPIVKTIAKQLEVQMTKELFANGLSKTIPVIGGITSGGLTYVSFRVCSYRLNTNLKKLPISDPKYYESLWKKND